MNQLSDRQSLAIGACQAAPHRRLTGGHEGTIDQDGVIRRDSDGSTVCDLDAQES